MKVDSSWEWCIFLKASYHIQHFKIQHYAIIKPIFLYFFQCFLIPSNIYIPNNFPIVVFLIPHFLIFKQFLISYQQHTLYFFTKPIPGHCIYFFPPLPKSIFLSITQPPVFSNNFRFSFSFNFKWLFLILFNFIVILFPNLLNSRIR